MSQHHQFEGATHVFICRFEPTNSGKRRGWYIYREWLRGTPVSPLKSRVLEHPVFSATQAQEIARQFALENRAEALLTGQPTDD